MRSVEPDGGVDAVGQQVAGHAAAGRVGIQSPSRRAALRHVGVDRPVLQEVGAVVKNPAESTFVDQLLGERYGGNASIVVPNHVFDAGLFDGLAHLFAFGLVHRQWFFAQDHLARFGRGDRNLFVQVVRRANIDRIDVIAFEQLAPIGLDRLIAPVVGERFRLFFVASTDGFENRFVFEIGKK